MTLLANFERKVAPEPNTGCFLWTAYCNSDGYGAFAVKRKPQLAHRVAYRLYVGEIPAGKLILHRCDMPSCVNPAHLFIGTNADNMRDMVNKGRADRTKKARGEQNGAAKLTTVQVAAICADTRSQYVIASEYGISQGHVSNIKSGKKWKI